MRIGTYCYCTAQGLGHLAKSFYDAGVITDVVLHPHGKHENHYDWYPPHTPRHLGRNLVLDIFEPMLSNVQVMLFFETPFQWELLAECKRRGIKTVVVPMYEWWPKNPPYWPDLFACPSNLDLQILEALGQRTVYLPIPVDPSTWKLRTEAKRYLHNAGHIGHREHKGTRQLLEAVPFLRSELELTVRCQDKTGIERLSDSLRWSGDARVKFELDQPRGSLFDGHDVYVAPEKFNGLSLPLQEARAAGMLVMTSDRFPHNDWLPEAPLIPVSHYERACISRNYLEFDEATVRPEDIAATMDAWYGKDVAVYSQEGWHWAQEHSWEALKSKWLEALASA